jgi:hypothetical protein
VVENPFYKTFGNRSIFEFQNFLDFRLSWDPCLPFLWRRRFSGLNQVFMLSRQVLCHLNHTSSPKDPSLNVKVPYVSNIPYMHSLKVILYIFIVTSHLRSSVEFSTCGVVFMLKEFQVSWAWWHIIPALGRLRLSYTVRHYLK